MKFDTIKLSELAAIQTGPFGSQLHKEDYVVHGTPIVTVEHLGDRKFTEQNLPCVSDKDKERLKKYILKTGDIVFSRVGSVDRCSYVSAEYEGWLFSGRCLRVRPCEKLNPEYLYYFFSLEETKQFVRNIATGATMPSINTKFMGEIPIRVPSLETQNKIASILWMIDDKIELNEKINKNLEEQLSALFVNMFGHFIDSLDNSDIKLGDLIESVDNRGKTPPLSDEPTDYPIIDVRALSGNSRIIDYTNCTKYVSKETYNNWFRSGHPKEYDILISTVGSLAEMKIFLGTTGCIAQNVVGFRTKGISPLYLYQYLNYIKNDLVAYNIGSVQPSIKVTHIIKHSIYVASKEDIEIFDSIARDITKKIFANCQENEALKQMRDILLPKLMSGELDVSDIEI